MEEMRKWQVKMAAALKQAEDLLRLRTHRTAAKEDVTQALWGALEAWRQPNAEGFPRFTILQDPHLLEQCTLMLRNTAHGARFPGHPGNCANMLSARVTGVKLITNRMLFDAYMLAKSQIKRAHKQLRKKGIHTNVQLVPNVSTTIRRTFPWVQLDPTVGEELLLHGTGNGTVEAIAEQGFNERFSRNGLYGDGIYFAEQSCKANRYSDAAHYDRKHEGFQGCLIVTRVALGECFETTQQRPGERMAPLRNEADLTLGTFDGVVFNPDAREASGSAHRIGMPQTQEHREFVIFDGSRAYPEFAVYFELTIDHDQHG